MEEMKPGPELDLLIATKVMGWFPTGQNRYENTIDGHVVNRAALGLPKYSTDIAAAWAVVEKLRNLRPEALVLTVFASPGGNYKVEVYCELIRGEGQWMRMPVCNSIEDTAPHAICLAALKACADKFESSL